ncbi:MAG: c-type cytochrome domain-containing protein, partial [Verrucomicrobiota bacterium]
MKSALVHPRRFWLAVMILAALPAWPARARAAAPAVTRDALGVLRDECLACHNPEKKKGGLVLASREALLRGGSEGPALVPGRPDSSRLLALLAPGADPHMPPKRQLSPAQVRAVRAWIQ